ncbi:MAG: putative membrane protein EpsK [Calditrichaeota bacterium]|nr:putative membrane protein EpsK [Calditrichota bacterium]
MHLRRGRGRGRQMLRNLITNLITIFLQMVLGMMLTRYLIHTLGPAEYGVVPLSFQVVAFFTLITMSVNSSVGRYLTIEITQDDIAAARTTFNSSFWGLMRVFAVLVPVGLVLAWLSPHFLKYAPGAEAASQRVLYAVVFSFFTITTSSSLMITAFARNRLDLQNYVRISWHVVRTTVPYVMIGVLGWGLDGVSVGIILGSLTHLALSVRTWRRLNPELRLSPKLFDKQRFLDLADMSVWLMADKVGRILQFSSSIIVVNIILGPEAAGRYGAIMIFARSLIMYNRSMRMVATPVMYSMYGRRKYDELRGFLVSFVRFEGIMMALPLGALIVLAEPLLEVWLGPEFTDLAPVVNLLLVGLILTMPMIPVRTIFAAKKRVKLPGLLSMGTGVVNIAVSIWMMHPDGLDMGLIAVPISALLTTQLKNFLFVPLYAAHLMGNRWHTYFAPLIRITIAYAFMLAFAYGLRLLIDPHSWLALLLVAAIATAIYLPLAVKVFLSAADREHVRQLKQRRRRRPDTEAAVETDGDTGFE